MGLRISAIDIPGWVSRFAFMGPRSYNAAGPSALWLHRMEPDVLRGFLRDTLQWHRQMNVWQLFVACVSRGVLTTPFDVWSLLDTEQDVRVVRDPVLDWGMPTFIWRGGRANPNVFPLPPGMPVAVRQIEYQGRPATQFGPGYAFGEAMDLRNPTHRKHLKLLIKDLHRAQLCTTPVEGAMCRQIEDYVAFYLSASGGPTQVPNG